ncbi:MAG TPA: endonuclease III [Gemmatimonadaceae bacterium]|jgi:endonuclease III|nr:endonuclease III [Gemmatimonadaceae bacterium]
MAKRPFDIDEMVRRIRHEVKQFADAAMFDLADQGFSTPFHQLAACVISIRTFDEVSLPAAIRLFKVAPTPEKVAKLSVRKIASLIKPASFYETKAYNIRDMAKRVVDEFGGKLPCDYDVMTSFRGVGPKCANLTLGIACGARKISVDIHVHRITNRWGYVQATESEGTREALEKVLPKKYWVEINRLLVPFGKHICTGRLPKCSICPVLEYCRQVGVTAHR